VALGAPACRSPSSTASMMSSLKIFSCGVSEGLSAMSSALRAKA
jgi:hypothetical protein